MNTNDFYKELFEKYAFDEDKIRRNAIKAAKTPAWQRTLGAHWKSVAGAAAAVAVTVGAVAYISGNSGNDGIDIVSPDNLLSASQRLQEAEQNYYNLPAEENDILNIYLTFKENVCYSDMAVSLSALAGSDEIEIQRIYLNDGTTVSGMTDISTYAETSAADKCISGAKLSAPSKCYRDLNDLSRVDVAEVESEGLNDQTFSPLVREDGDPLANDMLSITTTAPVVTTAPFSFESETTTTAVTTTADTTVPAVSDTDITEEDPDIVEVVPEDPDITVESEDEYVITAPTELDDPELTASETTTAETTAEITVTSDEFEAPDVGLMTRIYQLNAQNALETVLIGEHAIVLSKDQVYFFMMGGVMTDSRPRAIAMGSPKIAYSDEKSVIVTGCDESGKRNMIVMLDLSTNVLYGDDNATNIGTAEIGRVYYSASDNRYFVSTFADSSTYFYEVTVDPMTGLQFRALVEFAGPVAAAGYKNGTLWFTGSEDNVNYSLYSFDCVNGVLEKCAYIGTSCKVHRSPSFGSFILTAGDDADGTQHTYVFDMTSSTLISVTVGSDPMIVDLNGLIYVNSDGTTYRLTDGVLENTDANISFTRELKSNFSIVSQDNEKILVAENNPNIW